MRCASNFRKGAFGGPNWRKPTERARVHGCRFGGALASSPVAEWELGATSFFEEEGALGTGYGSFAVRHWEGNGRWMDWGRQGEAAKNCCGNAF